MHTVLGFLDTDFMQMRSKSGEVEAGDDGDNFRRAREAYEILADPDARARHDAGQSAASRRATTILEVDLGACGCVFLSGFSWSMALPVLICTCKFEYSRSLAKCSISRSQNGVAQRSRLNSECR